MPTPQNLSEVIAYIAKQEQERVAAQIAEAQQKLVTTSYDKAATYTTVIIFGGYAGFFALWQLSKDYLSKDQALWSALFILVSLLSFVLFEVVKMILVTRSVFKQLKPLKDPLVRNDPQKLLRALQQGEEAQSRGMLNFVVAWSIAVFLSLAGAIAGACVIGYAFITGLAK